MAREEVKGWATAVVAMAWEEAKGWATAVAVTAMFLVVEQVAERAERAGQTVCGTGGSPSSTHSCTWHAEEPRGYSGTTIGRCDWHTNSSSSMPPGQRTRRGARCAYTCVSSDGLQNPEKN